MSTAPTPTAPPATGQPFRWLPVAQLVRLPNVFTAMADIGMAALMCGALPSRLVPFVLLVLASSCLYCGGMVWNDYFDFEQDLRERPFRPLPSYRIALPTAARFGAFLLVAGVFFAALSGQRSEGWDWSAAVVALLLVGAILLYDGWLKRTWAGPISMGLCRFLNVLLGLTVAVDSIQTWGFVLALVIGTYIVGVTWFARKEAVLSKQIELTAAAAIMLAALPLALFLPVLGKQLGRSEGGGTWAFLSGDLGHILFPYLLVAFGFFVGLPVTRAIRNPGPRQVQMAVKRCRCIWESGCIPRSHKLPACGYVPHTTTAWSNDPPSMNVPPWRAASGRPCCWRSSCSRRWVVT
jgi:4-hydroxybenzoate polyprenyltransferase